MKRFFLTALLATTALTYAHAATGLSSVVFTNLSRSYFDIDFGRAPNQIVKLKLEASQFDTSGGTITIINTPVASNPTIPYLPYKNSPTTFGDSALRYIDPNTVGATELDVDVLVLGFGNVPTTLFAGENDINTADHSVLVLASADASAQLRLSSGDGPVQELLLYHAGTTPFTLYNGDALYDDGTSFLYLSGGDWSPSGDGESMLLFRTPRGWSEASRFGGPTNVVTQELWVATNLTLRPVDFSLQVKVTNLLEVVGDTAHLDLGITSGQPTIDGSSGTGLNIVGPGSSGLFISPSVIKPESAGINLSGPNVTDGFWFQDLGLDGRAYFRGFFATTNYSRLAISHTGTNGAVVFASQSNGSAGLARPFNFNLGGTNLWELSVDPSGSTFSYVHGLHGGRAFVSVDDTGNNAAFRGGENSLTVQLNSSSEGINIFSNNRIVPVTSGMDLGTEGSPFGQLHLSQFIEWGATNGPPVNAITPATWVLTLVNGDTNVYYTPLYK